jgi:uncharacterized protein with PIN domain
MALSIKNREVERLAAEVARLAGENKTEAVRRALDERMARLTLRVVKRDRMAELRRYLEQEVWPAVPRRLLGRRLSPREQEHWREALDAFARFGRSRHRAKLNFGDCLSYAVAKLAGQPLLCVGDDFAKTDISLA